MPAPLVAILPEMVELLMVKGPALQIAPPAFNVELFENVEPFISNVAAEL